MTASSMALSSHNLQLAGVVGDSIVDGPGLRVTVFAQGCPRCCPGCHNPETQGFEPDAGQWMTAQALYEQIHSFPLARGLTLSGGEPFAQAAGFAALAKTLAVEGYEICSYSGFTFEQLLQGEPAWRTLLESLHVLIDGEFLQQQHSLELRWRGSANQRILDVPKSLAQGRAILSDDPRWQA